MEQYDTLTAIVPGNGVKTWIRARGDTGQGPLWALTGSRYRERRMEPVFFPILPEK